MDVLFLCAFSQSQEPAFVTCVFGNPWKWTGSGDLLQACHCFSSGQVASLKGDVFHFSLFPGIMILDKNDSH